MEYKNMCARNSVFFLLTRFYISLEEATDRLQCLNVILWNTESLYFYKEDVVASAVKWKAWEESILKTFSFVFCKLFRLYINFLTVDRNIAVRYRGTKNLSTTDVFLIVYYLTLTNIFIKGSVAIKNYAEKN